MEGQEQGEKGVSSARETARRLLRRVRGAGRVGALPATAELGALDEVSRPCTPGAQAAGPALPMQPGPLPSLPGKHGQGSPVGKLRGAFTELLLVQSLLS